MFLHLCQKRSLSRMCALIKLSIRYTTAEIVLEIGSTNANVINIHRFIMSLTDRYTSGAFWRS